MAELLIVATLMPRTALHIGGMGGNRVTDDLVRRDAAWIAILANRCAEAIRNAGVGSVSYLGRSIPKKQQQMIQVDAPPRFGFMTHT